MVVVDTVLEKRRYSSFFWRDSLNFANWKFDVVLVATLALFADMAMRLFGEDWAGALLSGSFGIVIALWFLLERRSTLKKHLRLLDIPLYRYKTPLKFEINDKKIVSQNKKNGRMESVKWSAIRKVAQTGKYFFLYVDKHSAMIVAKADIKEDGSEKIASYWKAEQARRQERKNATKVIEG